MVRVLRNLGASFVVPVFVVSTLLAASPEAAGQTPEPTPDPTAPFFSGDTLHEVKIDINTKDWDLLRQNFTDKTYYPCNFTVDGTIIRDVGIRPRGNGSRSKDKPGLRVDFNRYREQLFLGVLTAVILDNVTQDQSMIRERVSMATFQRMGLPAPRETHAKVYVNDVYLGMYAFVEEINKNYLKRVYGGTVGAVENDGYLYEYEWVRPLLRRVPWGRISPLTASCSNPRRTRMRRWRSCTIGSTRWCARSTRRMKATTRRSWGRASISTP